MKIRDKRFQVEGKSCPDHPWWSILGCPKNREEGIDQRGGGRRKTEEDHSSRLVDAVHLSEPSTCGHLTGVPTL